MRKSQKECVIHMHKNNREKTPDKFYHGKMVFLPWRNEDVDIIGDSSNYARRYSAELEKIMEMEGKYNKCVQTLEEAVEEFDQYGHAWQNVAPTAEQECIQAEIEGHIEERHQDHEELDEHRKNSNMKQLLNYTCVLIHKQIQA